MGVHSCCCRTGGGLLVSTQMQACALSEYAQPRVGDAHVPSTTNEEPAMLKYVPYLVAAVFAFGSVNAIAQEKGKKPTAEECKKDPKMAGCEKKEEKK